MTEPGAETGEFRAAWLPSSFHQEPDWDSLPSGLRIPRLDEAAALALLDGLEEAGGPLRSLSNEEVTTAVGRAAERLLDPSDPLRQEALAWLPRDGGLSRPMAGLVLDRMARDWTTDRLSTLLETEFPDPRVLEGFRPGFGGDRLRALGDPLAFHLGAGSVPGTGATSMVRSLLVRSPVLLKPGRGDVVLPVLLARGIAETDERLERAVAVVYWPGGSRPVLEERALERARRVVAYGGLEAVDELRGRLPVTTSLVAYHHRISVGVVGRGRLTGSQAARRVARKAAEATSAYDQRGCVSPQVIWVEEGGAVGPDAWAELLALEMEAVAEEFPAGPLDALAAGRIQQLRGEAELHQAAGGGHRLFASAGTDWTVLYEPASSLEGGCEGRLIRVQPISDLDALPELLAARSRVLQSVGVEAEAGRRRELAEALAGTGVSRVTDFSRQAWPAPWWTHDGQGPLRALVRWTTLEGDPA